MGNLEIALNFFEKYNSLEKELYESYPKNVEFKNGLAISYEKLGTFYRDKKKDNSEAKTYFEKCYTLWSELAKAYPNYAEFKNNLNNIINKHPTFI